MAQLIGVVHMKFKYWLTLLDVCVCVCVSVSE